jgi:NADPH:quinone reductase-like Zn-dependent oxidoreductase
LLLASDTQRGGGGQSVEWFFELLRDGIIHPVVVDRLPLAAAREVHARIDAGGLGGKIVLLPWPESS